jgi:hypothetical protein
MSFASGFGPVSPHERRLADLFYESLTGVRARGRPGLYFPEDEPSTAAPAQKPYLPQEGRNFVPQRGIFKCAPNAFVVVPASFLPERATDANAAIDAALAANGLNPAQTRQVTKTGLAPIAKEFGPSALAELLARLRWSAKDIATWGQGANSMLVPRLLIHIPGHFRELARRAPDAREAFVLECIGWLLMARLRGTVAGAIRKTVWVPPLPDWVTAVPNPIPALSAEVSRLMTRFLLIDTTMIADQWNTKLTAWGGGLAGRQWQAEVFAPDPGRPFYAALTTVPAHISTAAVRTTFSTAWGRKVDDARNRNQPHAAGATQVTLSGLRNAVELRECDNDSPHLPARTISNLDLPPGLEFVYDFPIPKRTVTKLALLTQLHPVYTALFNAIRELGWNDLLYEFEGGACFRGVHHPAVFELTINGTKVVVNAFKNPDQTTVTRLNTNATAAQRATAIAACVTAQGMSEHGLGAATDFNVPENEQKSRARPWGSMDPRIVAIFEAFHFKWGACFDPTDPMHFEYAKAPWAPAAANAGTLGQVVAPRLLMPVRATERVLA